MRPRSREAEEAIGAVVDLRSDTVTRPTASMRRAMAEAVVGDDVLGDDPTVERLERRVAERLGHEAALFVPSGTQSNLIALLCHCDRGDEYIAGKASHVFKYEAGGSAVVGGIQPCPLPQEPDGTLDLVAVAAAVKPDDPHFPRTRLLCLENTWNGRVLPLEFVDRAVALARDRGLARHLDGARIWNAAVASGERVERLARGFDTVSVCLSKGLGAPVGSLLAGSAELVARARRWRKLLGGGMRQAGVLAAAGLVALDEGCARLADDHRRAAELAEGLGDLPGIEVESVATNMVWLAVEASPTVDLVAALAAADVLIEPPEADGQRNRYRLVLHREVDDAGVAAAVAAFARELQR